MERKTVRTNPGMFDAVLAIVEDLAGEFLVRVVARLLAHAVKPRLLQQLRQPIRFLALFIYFRLLQQCLSLHALCLRHLQAATPVS